MSGSPSTTAAAQLTLLDSYDALLLDLDGTLLLAGSVIEHAPEALSAARRSGIHILIVTNNASRTPAEVAERLTARSMTVAADEVVNSPQAAAALLVASHHPGEPVLVVGTGALDEAVAGVGLRPVRSADDAPGAVVQGYSPDTGWRDLAEACLAIRAGADWVATNADSTLPTDRGILPGNGAMVAALVTATGRHPRVAGKPERPLLDAAVARVGARRPLVVGDRLNTDIAAAAHAGLDSLMVLTGVSSVVDLLDTEPRLRPTYVAADLRGLTAEVPVVRLADYDGGADTAALRDALEALQAG
jgi:HAD superfamily hydrolase (TIGR01450 family)